MYHVRAHPEHYFGDVSLRTSNWDEVLAHLTEHEDEYVRIDEDGEIHGKHYRMLLMPCDSEDGPRKLDAANDAPGFEITDKLIARSRETSEE